MIKKSSHQRISSLSKQTSPIMPPSKLPCLRPMFPHSPPKAVPDRNLNQYLMQKRDPNQNMAGKPFIHPPNPQQNHRSFFLNPKRRKAELIQLGRNHQEILNIASQQLNFTPSNFQGYMKYIERINDEQQLNQVRLHISNIINSHVSSQMPEDFPFGDIRYSKSKFPNQHIFGPQVIGDNLLEFDINLDNYSIPIDGERIIIQCFLSGVVPYVRGWPPTLSLYINGVLIKPSLTNARYQSNFSLLDITEFGNKPLIHVSCKLESRKYLFLVRYANYRSVKSLIEEIRNKPPAEEMFDPNDLSLFCPMNGKKIKYPGKGNNCHHTQPFDLKTFLKNYAFCMDRARCPICNTSIEFSTLIYSHQTEKILNKFKENEIQNINDEIPESFEF